MAFDTRSLDDYIDVAERMTEFYDRYPEGSLRAADPAHPWEMAIVTGNKKDGTPTTQTFIVYSALAYRHPGDPAPGVGVAWEIFPGRTPYTLGSELMNAETSAWGRAMAALGIATKRGIATRQEVRNRRAEREDGRHMTSFGLSRTGVSDEELDANGEMTREQAREHDALTKGADGGLPPDEAAKVERVTIIPPDDPFTGIPGADGTDPEDRHGTSTAEQIKQLNIRLTSHGHRTKAARLKYVSDRIGHEVYSTADLSFSEAAKILRELPSRPKVAAP